MDIISVNIVDSLRAVVATEIMIIIQLIVS